MGFVHHQQLFVLMHHGHVERHARFRRHDPVEEVEAARGHRCFQGDRPAVFVYEPTPGRIGDVVELLTRIGEVG